MTGRRDRLQKSQFALGATEVYPGGSAISPPPASCPMGLGEENLILENTKAGNSNSDLGSKHGTLDYLGILC